MSFYNEGHTGLTLTWPFGTNDYSEAVMNSSNSNTVHLVFCDFQISESLISASWWCKWKSQVIIIIWNLIYVQNAVLVHQNEFRKQKSWSDLSATTLKSESKEFRKWKFRGSNNSDRTQSCLFTIPWQSILCSYWKMCFFLNQVSSSGEHECNRISHYESSVSRNVLDKSGGLTNWSTDPNCHP